jgi:GntR family transcriptional regulator
MAEMPQSLYARLRDELRAGILDGRLKPHQNLPSEAELTAAHGVSRITVRQALGELQKEGLIVRLQGKGAFVSHPSQPPASQSLNRLQGLGEALAGQGRAVHSRRLSWRQLRASTELAGQLQLKAGEPVCQLVMLRYLEREPLSVNTSHFPLALGERIAKLDLSGRDLIDVLETELRLQVAQADLDIAAAPLPSRAGRWLKVAEGEPALTVHRVLRDGGGMPLQVEDAVYRADAFSYRLSLTR